MTIQVTLSGGDFGGDVMDIPDQQLEIVRTNEAGDWLYVRSDATAQQAVFAKFTPTHPAES
jgi:hypothetical protein